MTGKRERRERRPEKKDQAQVVEHIKGVGTIYSFTGKQRFHCKISNKPTTNFVKLNDTEFPLHPEYLDQAKSLFMVP